MEEVQQVTTKEPQQVTTKEPKNVEAGKRLAEYNHRKREELKAQKRQVEPILDSRQYYSIGAVLAVDVIGGLGYYLYQGKRGEANVIVPLQQPSPKTSKSEME